MAARFPFAVEINQKYFPMVLEAGPVIPGLAGFKLRVGPPPPCGHDWVCHLVIRRVVVKNPLAGLADHNLSSRAHFIVCLRPQHDLARQALVIAGLGKARPAMLRDPIILRQQIGIHAGSCLFAFGVPLGQLLFVFRSPLPGLDLFLFDLCRLRFQLHLGRLYILLADLAIDHQLQDLVFVGANVLLCELDLVQQSFVLFVGLDGERLVAVLGDFLLLVLNRALVFTAGRFVGLDSSLGFFQDRSGSSQPFLNGGDALGQRGDFFLQTQDFPISLL